MTQSSDLPIHYVYWCSGGFQIDHHYYYYDYHRSHDRAIDNYSGNHNDHRYDDCQNICNYPRVVLAITISKANDDHGHHDGY